MTVVDATGTFADLLHDAAGQQTGSLYVADAGTVRSGRVFFADGKIYSVLVDGFMPKIGYRLRTGGMLDQTCYEALLRDCGGDVYAPDAGERAVAAGLVTQDVIDAVYRELLLSSLGAIARWDGLTGRFDPEQATDWFAVPPVSVNAVLKAMAKRQERWDGLWQEMAADLTVDAVYPTADPSNAPDPAEVPPEVAAVAAAADGTRTVDEVAGECGLTRFETGHVLSQLVAAGIVAMTPAAPEAAEQQADPATDEALPQPPAGVFTPDPSQLPAPVDVTVPPPLMPAEVPPVQPDGYVPPVAPVAAPFDAVAPVPDGFVPPIPDEALGAPPVEVSVEDSMHFAPDVLSAVEEAARAPEAMEGEPDAFVAAADSEDADLPDGTDAGALDESLSDEGPEPSAAVTSEVPPLTGLTVVGEQVTQTPDISVVADGGAHHEVASYEPEPPGQEFSGEPVSTPETAPVGALVLGSPDVSPGTPALPGFLTPVVAGVPATPYPQPEVSVPPTPVAVVAAEPVEPPVQPVLPVPFVPSAATPVYTDASGDQTGAQAPAPSDAAQEAAEQAAREREAEAARIADEEALRQQREAAQCVLAQRRDDLDAARQALDGLTHSHAAHAQQRAAAHAEKGRVAQHLADAETDKLRLGHAAGDARLAAQQTETAHAVAMTELAHAEAVFAQAQAALEDARTRVGAMSRTREDLNVRAEAAVRDLARANERFDTHQQRLAEVTTRIDRLDADARHFDDDRAAAEARLHAAEAAVAEAEQQVTELG